MSSNTESGQLDVIVIGGGPGGYVAAIKAAQLGGKVALVEKDSLGGVCLNRGCIPTKAMIASADVYGMASGKSKEFGVNVGDYSLDYAKVTGRRDSIVKQLVSGVGFLMKKNGIKVYKGVGSITSKNTVEVSYTDGKKESITAKNIIIATGSEPIKVPIPGLDGDNIWDSDGALKASAVPKSMLVVGGGVIGVEWGYIFNKLGTKVTIVELMPQIMPLNDAEIAMALKKILDKSGIVFHLETKVTKVEHKDGQEVVTISSASGESQITVDKVLVAVGRKSVSDGLGLEKLGITTERGKILVNTKMQTSVPNIYAIGDVTGGMLLAHKASQEGEVAAENIMGHKSEMKYSTVPAAVYTSPEVATVGLTEDAAKQKGIAYKVGRSEFMSNGKAMGIGEREGFVKFVVDAKYGEILGCHMIGPHVSDLIQSVVIAMEAEATIEGFAATIHGHPTLSEVVREAAMDVNGQSIHKA
ncbi:MAG: dihydrolipoyl dehydrogenase [Armatimonadota bacterium]